MGADKQGWVLAAGNRGVAQDAVGDELRVFDKVGGISRPNSATRA
jgi:hypothetical protein